MATISIPRYLLPRGQVYLRSPRLQHLTTGSTARHASTSSPTKARVLEKPDKFRPPSHPARLRAKPRSFGPALSEQDLAAQKTKQYPHMMPPEGTVLHKFLTSRMIHTWITLSILTTLAFFTVLTNFLHTTPYKDQLPPNSFFLSHPFAFIARYMEVYSMHTAYISAETAERRKQKVEDVRKRSEFRKAHGMDNEGLFGGWTARSDEELMGPALREGGTVGAVVVPESPVSEVVQQANVEEVPERTDYVDFEGKKKPLKKWFGIW